MKTSLIRAANTFRTNYYANWMGPHEPPLPASLRKSIAKAKAEDNPHPTLSKRSSLVGNKKPKEELGGGIYAQSMIDAAAESVRSNAQFCFFLNILNIAGIFSNVTYVFFYGISFSFGQLESICRPMNDTSSVSAGSPQEEIVLICHVFTSYFNSSCVLFALLGIKLIIDAISSDAPRYLSEIYTTSVAEQVAFLR